MKNNPVFMENDPPPYLVPALFYIVYPPFVCNDRLHLGMRLIVKRIYDPS